MSAVTPPLHEVLMARRLAAVARAGAGTPARRTLFVVVREPDMAALVRGLSHVVAGMSPEDRDAWLANFTKVRLFAGRPDSSGVTPLLTHVENEALGFVLLDAEARHPRVADLLVPLRSQLGPVPDGHMDLAWGAGSGRWELDINAAGLDWPRYLVHVLHLLAEAALENPEFGGQITIRHRSDPPVCTGDVIQLRLDLDATPPTCRAVLRPSAGTARNV